MPSKVVRVEKILAWHGPYCAEASGGPTCDFLHVDYEANEDSCDRYVKQLKRDRRDSDLRCFRCRACLRENP